MNTLALPDELYAELERCLGARPVALDPMSTSHHHHALCVRSGDRVLFLKCGQGELARASLDAEARSLLALGALHGVHCPEVLAAGASAGWAWIVLPWLDPSPAQRRGHEAGAAVAALHAQRAPCWGGESGGYIASLEQDNTPDDDGLRFWVTRRLAPGLELAADALMARDRAEVVALMDALGDAAAPKPMSPVWLHGDLWAGNVLMSARGRCWLIDPAVYAGDPRIDLAMTRLFGGFSPAFYKSWHQIHGHRDDDAFFEQVYVVWPLLVHAALFGGRYGRAAAEAARRALALWPA